jgi:hypothetical protein
VGGRSFHCRPGGGRVWEVRRPKRARGSALGELGSREEHGLSSGSKALKRGIEVLKGFYSKRKSARRYRKVFSITG